MARIGGLNFFSYSGGNPSYGQALETFEKRGFDGVGAILIGKRGEKKEITVYHVFSDVNALVTFRSYLNQMRGHIVAVADDIGREYNALVLNVTDKTDPKAIFAWGYVPGESGIQQKNLEAVFSVSLQRVGPLEG